MNLKSLALNAVLKINEKSGYSVLHAICINKDVYSFNRIAMQAVIAGHDIKGHRVSEKAEKFAGMTTEEILGQDHYVNSDVLWRLDYILSRDPTGFLKAVTEGDVDKVTRLVKEGVDVNKKIDPGYGEDEDEDEDEACSLMTLASMSGNQEVLTALIKLGGDVNPKSLGTSLLSVACAWNNYSAVKLLMRKGADVNAENSPGNTALNYAAANGNVEIVKLLMDYKARPDDVDWYGNSALHLALAPDVPAVLALTQFADYDLVSVSALSRTKKTQTSHFLIKQGVELQKKNNLGQTPLYLAMCSGDTEAVLHLAEQKKSPLTSDGDVPAIRRLVDMKLLDVNMKDKNKETPLHKAAREDNIEAMSFLLEVGADINAVDGQGNTALRLAIYCSHPKAALKLIKGGAKLEVKYNKDQTPLHMAAGMGSEELVGALMEQGNVNTTDKHGWTPLHIALQYRHAEIVEILLEAGAQAGFQTPVGRTPLHVALEHCDVTSAKLLLRYGSYKDSADESGMTALHLAARDGYKDIVLSLVDQGSDVNAQDKSGKTPLHRAAKEGKTEMVSLLVQRGSDVTLTDKKGHTALQLAEKKSFPDTVEALKKFMSKE